MIEINIGKSHKIIKKGDYFSIYITMKNGHKEEIKINEVRLFQPTGFIPIELTTKRMSRGVKIIDIGMDLIDVTPFAPFHGLIDRAVHSIKEELKMDPGDVKKGNENPPVREIIVGPYITHKPDKLVQSNCDYREDFNLKAGTRGTRPRPDTYTISCEVTYEIEGKIHYKNTDIEVSIFPSVGSMLFGTFIGSILGTIVKTLTDNPPTNVILDYSLIPSIIAFISILAANLILGFMVGVTLMRKKDVQPFLTVEDFWGGVLLGFLVGYLGKQFFDEFFKI